MAGLVEINSFIGKFVSLWQSGRDANLKVESKAGKAFVSLEVDLGCPEHPTLQPQAPLREVRAAQVRRRLKRAAKRKVAAEAEQAERIAAGKAEQESVEAKKAEQDRVTAEEAEQGRVAAEEAEHGHFEAKPAVCDKDQADDEKASHEVENAKCEERICSVDFYPESLEEISDFRDNLEKYFDQRKDVIEKVIECKIDFSGTKVKLKTLVKQNMWFRFFAYQEKYSDLKGIRTLRHACQNLAQCDQT